MFTIVLTKHITDDKDAYKTLLDTIVSIQKEFLGRNDQVCFNIQCPNYDPPRKLKSDNQRNMIDPIKGLREFSEANLNLKKRSKTYELLKGGQDFDVLN